MTLEEKLKILADSAKYDASCSSSGSTRKNKNGLGNAAVNGICHSFSADGRCISLLKILLTNCCIFDCKYCINRKSNNVKRTIFTPEENGAFSVLFPDLEGCYSCGDDLQDALEMAEDALALTLYGYETDGKPIPAPSPLSALAHGDCEFINYIACDTLEYRKMYNNKSVKKTLTIPEWLNEAALSLNINFSQVLQDALTEIVQKQKS